MEKKRSTLLIVDDDALNRALLRNIFQSLYEIEEAGDGQRGLDAIRRDPERLCAVLLDVVMPKLTGIQVLQQLAEEEFPQRTPVFLITAEATGETVGEAYRLGVMDVIQKPLDLFVVRRRVQSVIELYEARKRLSGQVESQAEKIIRLNQGMIEALATAIEFRSEESGTMSGGSTTLRKRCCPRRPWGRDLPRIRCSRWPWPPSPMTWERSPCRTTSSISRAG